MSSAMPPSLRTSMWPRDRYTRPGGGLYTGPGGGLYTGPDGGAYTGPGGGLYTGPGGGLYRGPGNLAAELAAQDPARALDVLLGQTAQELPYEPYRSNQPPMTVFIRELRKRGLDQIADRLAEAHRLH